MEEQLEPITVPWAVHVAVCCKTRENRTCCGRAAGDELVRWLRDRARAYGLRRGLVVHGTGCMDHCGAGTTVVVHDGQTRRGFNVHPDGKEALWSVVREALTNGNGYP